MEPEQCVEMMQALRSAYSKIAGGNEIPKSEQIYDLKHVLTEIKLCIISMNNSIDIMEKKKNKG